VVCKLKAESSKEEAIKLGGEEAGMLVPEF